jgi:Tol biopolymer transport system component
MSPEQIQGQEADARSDIFSFGLVLYELLTGRRAFRAENPASVIAAILKENPEPLDQVVPLSPPSLSRLITRALEKDPERRWQNVRDIALEVESILAAQPEASGAQPNVRMRYSWKTTALGVLLTLVACAALSRWLQDRPDRTIGNVSFLPLAFEPEVEFDPIFSPDGKSLVYSRSIHGARQLFVRSFSTQSAAQITECSRPCAPIAWSADGARVFYVEGGVDLLVTSASGGAPQLVMKSVSRPTTGYKTVAVSPDGQALVFSHLRPDGRSELVLSSPPGTDPKRLPDFPLVSNPPMSLRFSPDGRKLAASVGESILVVPFPSGKPRSIENIGGASLSWMPDSRHLVYSLLRSANEIILGDTETSAARVILRSENVLIGMDVSPDGTRMAYSSGAFSSGIMELSIDSGTIHPLRVTHISEGDGAYDPSGDRYVYHSMASGRGEILLREVSGDRVAQLTFGSPVAGYTTQTRGFPVFSPDARRIAFSQSGQIWTMPATGGQPAPVTPAPADSVSAPAWSPDSRWIVYQRGPAGSRELVKIDSAGQGQTMTLSRSPASVSINVFTRWSSTGHIAYLGKDGVRICNEDGSGDSPLVPGAVTGDFSRRGDLFYAIKRTGEKWTLLTVEVSTGRVLRTVGLEESREASLRNAWLHPDGKRMMYSRVEPNSDIWLLDGLPRPETGFMRLFRHWRGT